jgi:flagellar basal-body rod modification protein FlgD
MITNTLTSYNNTANISTDTLDNSKLTSTDFLNMYLKELSMQDPMDPMDSQKMLDQTMQMTTIEQANSQMEKTDEMITILNKNYMQQFTGIIGRTVNTNLDTVTLVNDGDNSVFNYYTPEAISRGTAYIEDTDGNMIGTIAIDAQTAGTHAIEWNGNQLDGTPAPAGTYKVVFSAVNTNNVETTITPGQFKVESVLIQDGETIINVGNEKYINLTDIYEFL